LPSHGTLKGSCSVVVLLPSDFVRAVVCVNLHGAGLCVDVWDRRVARPCFFFLCVEDLGLFARTRSCHRCRRVVAFGNSVCGLGV
jgi:hypothetical protein